MTPDVFAALAHDVRLRVFRLLVEAGNEGLPAGEIAASLEVPASTLSTHLAQLERVGLLQSRRERQRIIYAIDTAGTQSLVDFLVNDCCGGRPELCGFGKAVGKPRRAAAARKS